MVTSAATPADIVNAALIRIGIRDQVGSLYDGSEQARAAIAVYGQTRDNLLRSGDWSFAQGMVALTLLKSAPSAYVGAASWTQADYPQLGYKFEYAYPDDALEVRAIRPTPIFVPEVDPSPYSFQIANDNAYTPAKRVILTNLADAIGVYTRRVTDPATWPPDFAEALIETLSRALAPDPQVAAGVAAEARGTELKAQMEQG